MVILGVRCSNSDYTFCILSGDQASLTLEEENRIPFPKGYSELEILNWFYQEMTSLFQRMTFDAVGIKKAEGNVKRSNALEMRIQCEAILSLAAAQAGCRNVRKKMKSTVAKDLGLKGKGKYLKTFDTSAIDDFENYPVKTQEAILIAWSCM